MSSRTAAWGQPPVSTATMRSLLTYGEFGYQIRIVRNARRKSFVSSQKLSVFSCEDIVCHCGDTEALAKCFA